MILSKRMLKDSIMASLLYKILNFDLKTLFVKQPKQSPPAPRLAAQPKKAAPRQVDLPAAPPIRDADLRAITAESRHESRAVHRQENARPDHLDQAARYDRARIELVALQAARRRREQDEADDADRRRRAADDSVMFASMYSSPSPSQHRSCSPAPAPQETDNDRYSCSRSYAESPAPAPADSGSSSESYSSPSE